MFQIICSDIQDTDQNLISYMEHLVGVAKPVPGKVASQNRGFYTKDFYPDYLFGDGDHAGLNNTIHTDAGISICIWQVEDLPLFQHGIFTAGYQTPAVIIKTLDNKINFTAKHISKNLILPL
ncbi:unknown [Clostridium sp. CAG:58]|nr:unknown [Clostridium sp. CAG:58]